MPWLKSGTTHLNIDLGFPEKETCAIKKYFHEYKKALFFKKTPHCVTRPEQMSL